MKTLSIFSFCLLSTLFSFAQESADSIRVLFIGNSYSYYNDLPQTVQKIAATQELKVAIRTFLPGGSRFINHLGNKELNEAIRQGGWDYVVLQEQSLLPAQPTEKVVREVYPLADSLNSLVKMYNPDAQVIFYMTWGYKDGSDKVENYPLIATYEGMQERLKISYLEMAYSNHAWCAPVGVAWQQVRRAHPEYNLYNPDKSHPSASGSYLSAHVIFTTMYQKPYHTDVRLNLPAEEAEYLQQVAQQTVLENLALWNIKD